MEFVLNISFRKSGSKWSIIQIVNFTSGSFLRKQCCKFFLKRLESCNLLNNVGIIISLRVSVFWLLPIENISSTPISAINIRFNQQKLKLLITKQVCTKHSWMWIRKKKIFADSVFFFANSYIGCVRSVLISGSSTNERLI